MKNNFKYRIIFFVSAVLLLVCTVFLPGCERNDILVLMEDSSQFGDGSDGDIIITGSVNIISLYEDDNVAGVITDRGTNKGLNHGAGEYYPRNRKYIMARNFKINLGASLTVTQWNGSDSRLGVVWIACTEAFTNNGTINLNNKGGSGGAGHSYESGKTLPSKAGNGTGPGGGDGAGGSTSPVADGISAYGTADISITTWNHIYGSGGGGGSAVYGTGTVGFYGIGGSGGSNATDSNDGGFDTITCSPGGNGNVGGAGGGAVRIYAVNFSNTGTISCDGGNGGGTYDAGAGGGGSGGTIYIESTVCDIGTNLLTCRQGYGGASSNGPGDGSNGSVGRIAIKSPVITGSTTDPVYYNILQGSYQ